MREYEAESVGGDAANFGPMSMLVRHDVPDGLRRDLSISRAILIREAPTEEDGPVAGIVVYLRGEKPKLGEEYDGGALVSTLQHLMQKALDAVWELMGGGPTAAAATTEDGEHTHAHFACQGCRAVFCGNRHTQMKDGDACPECHIAVVEEVEVEEAPSPGGVRVAVVVGAAEKMLEATRRQTEALERMASALVSVATLVHEGVLRATFSGSTSGGEMPPDKR